MLKMRDIKENVAMANYTTMAVGGPADYLLRVHSPEAVKEACEWAANRHLRLFVLGEGSNIVVSDTGLKRLVLKVEVKGLEKLSETKDHVLIKVGGGEHWDSVVERAVRLNLSGIEAMSGIPGTAGAAPVQNAGAYGQEVSDTLVELEAYDTVARSFVTIPNAACGFGYRTSAFKTEAAGRFVITGITLRLSKKPPRQPVYESLKRYLDENQIEQPTLQQIRDGVLAVRARILPDPSVVPNSGSFFESPIVTGAKLADIEKKFGRAPSFVYGDKFKIPAGWIVEKCGFKGSEHFGFKIWPNHALVITNPSHGSYGDLMKMVELITNTVEKEFGLTLEPEPLFAR